ncbi:MAG: hypothetical protein HN352_10180 [Bacteroidetes bacterium]|nr:hypothetical protein [Bacteroidota bacterium]MBT4398922.1 hypothetical protein [Bacteroidota bacterium]
MKKKTTILPILIGFAGYFIALFLLTSYGNKRAHGNLNEAVLNRFEQMVLNGDAELSNIFKNYDFDFTSKRLSGIAVVEAGLWQIREDEISTNPANWIRHGGFSADEPELAASFRHFYDPTQAEGERYLKNQLDNLLNFYDVVNFNPKVDHIEWAIDHPDHAYNWENGKYAMELAIELPNPKDKDAEMAIAYRALGETLHLIADMGCPAHVRDDSHPSAFGQYLNWKGQPLIGSPDPYEELFEHLVSSILGASSGNVDPALIAKIKSYSSVKKIAEDFAVYTNANYFSDQTISGSLVLPRLWKHRIQPSPLLDDCTYQGHFYSTNISGHNVLMCTDMSYWTDKIGYKAYPYIDKTCVQSQAAALIPQIAAVGSHVMRIYFPKIQVNVSQITNQSIVGEVVHQTDFEYPDKLSYNGPIYVRKVGSDKEMATINCENGEFIGQINLGNANESDHFYAEIEFGGIKVKSDPKPLGTYEDFDSKWEFAYDATMYGLTRRSDTLVLRGSFSVIPSFGNFFLSEDDGHYSVSYTNDYDSYGAIRASGSIEFDATITAITNLVVNLEFTDLNDPTFFSKQAFKIPQIPLIEHDGKLKTYGLGGNCPDNCVFNEKVYLRRSGTSKIEYIGPATDNLPGFEYVEIHLKEPHK